MSFAKTFELLINDFCDKVSSTFNLDRQQVRDLWSSNSSQLSQTSSRVSQSPSRDKPDVHDTDTEITREKILSGSKDMLAAMCKKAGLKVTGKKDELTQRLTDFLANKKVAEPKVEKKVEKTVDQPVIRTVKDRTAELAIRKNKFGNFEHSQTGLVFNTESKMVFGRQVDDGKIADLTAEDIELCKKYKFPFKIPENLNTSKSLDDVKIEDLEEEVLDEDDLEDEEEDVDEDDVPDDE